MWRLKGVKDVDTNWMIHWMKVTFDDQVTSYDAIVKALAKEGFYVQGEPEYLEPEAEEE
jgi:hypothetical protein